MCFKYNANKEAREEGNVNLCNKKILRRVFIRKSAAITISDFTYLDIFSRVDPKINNFFHCFFADKE